MKPTWIQNGSENIQKTIKKEIQQSMRFKSWPWGAQGSILSLKGRFVSLWLIANGSVVGQGPPRAQEGWGRGHLAQGPPRRGAADARGRLARADK